MRNLLLILAIGCGLLAVAQQSLREFLHIME